MERQHLVSTSDLVSFMDRHLDETLDRLERGWTPVWEAQTQVVRSILTLASGALILSVSLTQVVGEKIQDPRGTVLLVGSWILFAASVALGVSRLGWMSQARALRAQIETMRGEIRSQMWKLTEGADVGSEFDRILQEGFSKASVGPTRAIRVHNVLGYIMGWAFLLGLVSLLLFSVVNLPF